MNSFYCSWRSLQVVSTFSTFFFFFFKQNFVSKQVWVETNVVKWRETKLFWVKQFWVNCSPSYIGSGFWNLWENSELQYLKTTILIYWKASRDEEPSQSLNHPTAQVSNINKLSHEIKWRKSTHCFLICRWVSSGLRIR